MKRKITLFTWGYYGWGNNTSDLVRAVDEVEASRGFEPPIFVDIRIRRAVRAVGFQRNNFERLLGHDRHRWMKSLGNENVLTRRPGIKIADPSAAEDLLDLVLDAAAQKRRLLFFCHCQWPREGRRQCHRDIVANLVLEAARNREEKIEIVEWPGGQPQQIVLDVWPKVFKSLKSRVSIPLEKPGDHAGLPWGSTVTVRSGDQTVRVISGPAICRSKGWALPVLEYFDDPHTQIANIEKQATEFRRSRGLERRVNASPARMMIGSFKSTQPPSPTERPAEGPTWDEMPSDPNGRVSLAVV